MKNIYQLFNDVVRSSPNKVACICDTKQVSYQQLENDISNLSANLLNLGVKQGDRIAVFCPNSIDFAVILFAAAKIGIAVAPLPISLKGAALKNSIERIDCQGVISWQSVTKKLLDSQFNIPLLVNIGRKVDNQIQLDELIKHQCFSEGIASSVGRFSVDCDFILTLTSGSTGDPKPIVFTQKNKIDRAITATANIYDLSSNDTTLVSTPLYHSLAQRSLILPLLLGGTAIILPKFTVESWIEAIYQHRVSFLFAVSSQLTTLIPHLKTAYDLSSLRCIVSSSAILSNESKVQLMKRLPCKLHECYGASELGVVSDFCVNQVQNKVGSVGKGLPILSVKITDENRVKVDSYQLGEIACRSPTQFKGYFLQPENTKKAYDDDGFFYTGDLGYLDEEGFLFYAGRKKDIIITGGINVYPQDIENVVNTINDIDECVAFGVSDKQFGEVIKLVYTSSVEVDLMSIKKVCLTELTDYQQPRYIEAVDQLPKSSLGKILRQKVREPSTITKTRRAKATTYKRMP